ncbi:MAG: hypothetical protein HY921_10890 [Elusimicrobia bacterium]|nr:hypothetical protein [Elusimicrobiota bacterium]
MKNFLAVCLVSWFGIPGWSQGPLGITTDNSAAFKELSGLTDCPRCWKRSDKPGPLAAKTAAGPKFKIVCELGGKHGADPDRVKHDLEIALIQQAYENVFDRLPPHLQQIALETTAVINHKDKSTALGWSAEDDLDYRYPDTEFYPKGTIKINYTEFFVRRLELGRKLGLNDPKVAKAFQEDAGDAITHELTHAWQYHNRPVRDLMMVQGSCPDGFCDEALIRETALKIEYEREAYAGTKRFDPDRRGIISDALENYFLANPQENAPGGSYHGLMAEKVLIGIIARGRTASAQERAGINPIETHRIVYYGQYIPARNVRALIELKKSYLSDGHFQVWENGDRLTNRCGRLNDIASETAPYFSGEEGGQLKEWYPYVSSVENRYRREMGALKEILRSRGLSCDGLDF